MFTNLPNEVELKIYYYKHNMESVDYINDLCNLKNLYINGFGILKDYYYNTQNMSLHDIKRISRFIHILRIAVSKFSVPEKDFFKYKEIQRFMNDDYKLKI